MAIRVRRRFKYDVCLSFAGEQRDFVRRVNDELVEASLRTFFDEEEQQALWGKHLTEELDAVYRKESRFCVMFISADYVAKMWTRHERRSAQARAVSERHEYLLPARFDDTELEGLPPTVHYIDIREHTPHTFAQLVIGKVRPRSRIPRLQVTYENREPWVQRGHMSVQIVRPGIGVAVVPSDGWTHRIGLYNPTGVPVRDVCVRLVSVEPAPTVNVLPLTLRKKDENHRPYAESQGFTVVPGTSEFVDVVMKSIHVPDMEVQHIVEGVTRTFLPPTRNLSLVVQASNLSKAIQQQVALRLTVLGTVEMALRAT